MSQQPQAPHPTTPTTRGRVHSWLWLAWAWPVAWFVLLFVLDRGIVQYLAGFIGFTVLLVGGAVFPFVALAFRQGDPRQRSLGGAVVTYGLWVIMAMLACAIAAAIWRGGHVFIPREMLY